MLENASARLRAGKDAQMGKTLGMSDGKENVARDEDATKTKRDDGVETPAVDDVRERFNRLRTMVENVVASEVGDVRVRAAVDAVETSLTEETFDACVGNVVGDWFSDGDSITAEGDKVLGVCLQSLYAPLRGDETLEALRVEKSALKRRLRRFDSRVAQTRGDKATKEDKKHLRPLYVRLAKIKDLISIREAGG